MPTVLITGANRGIGLELTRQYAAAGWDVIACCRKPKEAGDLKALKGKIEVKALDVAKPTSIAKLAAALKGRARDGSVFGDDGAVTACSGGHGECGLSAFVLHPAPHLCPAHPLHRSIASS